MPKKSAGILLYREVDEELQVFLIHPGGPFWAKKDEGAWSVPKGEIAEDEDPFAAAKREFEEEVGPLPTGDPIPLTPIRQSGGKQVYAWAIRADFDPATLRSNTFAMQWPPHSGKLQEFLEVDRAGWFPIGVAKQKILKGQVGWLEELVALKT